MLAFPTRRLGVVLKWTAILIWGTTVCGCSSYPLFRAYKGTERPLKEIAVLLVVPPIFIKTIDDKNYWICESCTRRAEYHLLAGHHSIVAYYHDSDYWGAAEWELKGNPITLTPYLSKGFVYRLSQLAGQELSHYDIYGNPLFPKSYALHIRSMGTIEEIASRPMMLESDAPSHWRKMRKILETSRPSNDTK